MVERSEAKEIHNKEVIKVLEEIVYPLLRNLSGNPTTRFPDKDK